MQRVINCYRMHGGIYTLRKIANKLLWGCKSMYFDKNKLPSIPNDNSFVIADKFIKFSKNDMDKFICVNNEYILNWIIPELGIGSGGHINLFRFMKFLADKGVKNRCYIYNSSCKRSEDYFKQFIKKYYDVESDNIVYESDVHHMKCAHGVVCTSWQTAYYAKNFNNVLEKFYFIQDFEPYFYSHSSEYFFAENTYSFGFYGITAGLWLQEKLSKEYGMDAIGYVFSYDKNLYKMHHKKDFKKRVFFYYRPSTTRRLTEIGIMALCILKKALPDVEIFLAGSTEVNDISFEFKNLGIVNLNELSMIYSQCDICVVLSATNLSLLPLEVMASNSVVLSNKGANNEWLLNDDNSILVEADPVLIAKKLQYYLNNDSELQIIRENGRQFAERTSWQNAGTVVYDAVISRLSKAIDTYNNGIQC